jgi:hypothetical protein
MKTAKSIIVVLFVLLTAQIASAYYCPSTGCLLSRDPIGEPGFQALQTASSPSGIGNSVLQPSGRWVNRDPFEALAEPQSPNVNEYFDSNNNPIDNYDAFGLTCVGTSSGQGVFHSNLWGHNFPFMHGPASSLTFTLHCPKCVANLLNYQVGYVGNSPPTSGTLHGHSFPDSWTTVSLTSAAGSDGSVNYTIVINVTSTTSLGNDWGLSGTIPGVFIQGSCCDGQGPPNRIPGSSP